MQVFRHKNCKILAHLTFIKYLTRMELSERINQLLKNKKVTAYEVSKKTGISESTLSRILNGNTAKLGFNSATVLANYFDVDLEWLRWGFGTMSKIDITKNNEPVIVQEKSEIINKLFSEINEQKKELKELYIKVGRLEEKNSRLQTENSYLRQENELLKKDSSTPKYYNFDEPEILMAAEPAVPYLKKKNIY